ncbi:hypothetical protein PVAG01_00661 [Phlyctema vagabunda]|uniref:Rhodanese domain-containing protein n=1 Tax=Phlyctema vagabunda TaxID=108571 RepID=A0ABR4PUV4_9HELO
MGDTLPREGHGISDPLTYTCSCPAADMVEGGLVLLFYRYFDNEPVLPSCYKTERGDLRALEAFHRDLSAKYELKGKIRIADEGFNFSIQGSREKPVQLTGHLQITIGGTSNNIQDYMQECIEHWSFSNLDLTTAAEQAAFFKPTTGCACVFPSLNLRICSEITPMGVTNYAPRNWSDVLALSPAEFHARSHAAPPATTLLLDVRNHYESRIGYFVSPHTGEPALRPPIRRFSQFPQYVRSHLSDFTPASKSTSSVPRGGGLPPKEIFTYCTGGIRCEKGVRFLYDQLPAPALPLLDSDEHPDTINYQHEQTRIYTLKGGIAAYLTWMEGEISAGRKTAEASLFKGKNYVFDARGSMGLARDGVLDETKVATCHGCGISEDRMGKCGTAACHLVLVLCEGCETACVACCPSCERRGREPEAVSLKEMCDCESAREKLLWGEKGKTVKSQGWKKQQRNKGVKMDIQIKMIH